jgi:predicted DNA-binding transcriptional regulator AlpA
MTRMRPVLPFNIDELDDDTLCPVAWVEEMTGLAGGTIRNKARDGSFPCGLQHPGGGVRWRLGDIRQWMTARRAARKGLTRPSGASPGPS